jgi:transglutaminase-like putative cysteine protease
LIYAVRHQSSYRYHETVDLSHHVLHLTPRELPWQRAARSAIRTLPSAPELAPGIDYFGNAISFFSILTPHDRLVVEMSAEIEVTPRPPVDPALTPPWEAVRAALDGDCFPIGGDRDAAEFVNDSPMVPASPEFAAYAMPSFSPGRPILEAALDLTHRISRDFTFDATATEVTTPLAEVLERQRGVCQDFAHAEVAALRSIGLAARYVSGYIRTYPAAGAPRLVGADASHAWVSVWSPDAGWVDLDPTNDLLVGEEHITLAWGRDYSDVSPIRGVILGSGEHALAVSVDVAPIG